jgi:hypothetical protein
VCALLAGCSAPGSFTQTDPRHGGAAADQPPTTAIAPASDEAARRDVGGGHVVRVLSPAEVEANRQMQERLLAAMPKQLEASRPIALPAARPQVDHIAQQTGNRDQGGRGTCTYFAAVAALEAEYKREGYGDLDLSEQYLDWIRNVSTLDVTAPSGGPSPAEWNPHFKENNIGSLGGGGSGYNLQLMKQYGIPTESDSPYIGDGNYENLSSSYYSGYDFSTYQWWNQQSPQAPLNGWNLALAQLPTAARTDTHYGVSGYELFSQQQMQNIGFIESLIDQGHDVAIDFALYDDWLGHDARWPVVKQGRNVVGGHAVLIIGYDHNRKFFVIKNSWAGAPTYDPSQFGDEWTDVAHYNGYWLVDYQYIANAVYGGSMVTQVVPPTHTDYFAAQAGLGNYQLLIYRRSDSQVVASGSFSWRHMPGSFWWLPRPDARAGDAILNSKEYRVNADLNYPNVTLRIDFDNPGTSYDNPGGTKLVGQMYNNGAGVYGTIYSPDAFLFGVPSSDLLFWAYR